MYGRANRFQLYLFALFFIFVFSLSPIALMAHETSDETLQTAFQSGTQKRLFQSSVSPHLSGAAPHYVSAPANWSDGTINAGSLSMFHNIASSSPGRGDTFLPMLYNDARQAGLAAALT